MRTMEQIDAWYEAEMSKARLEGKTEGKIEGKIEAASNMIRFKFGASALTSQLASQLEELNNQELDEFMVRMFNWQQLGDMEEWLNSKG